MKLTEKCKEDFEKWYSEKYLKDLDNLLHDKETNCFYQLGVSKFNKIYKSMQYGVLVDFFDSVGIRIYLKEIGSIQYSVEFYQYDGDKSWIDKAFNTRQEAREQAILKANEIYNSK